MKRPTKLAAFLLPFALLLGACDDANTTGADTGTVSLALTDAPGDFEAAWVTIDRIYLQPGSDEDPDGVGDMDGRGHDRVDLMTEDLTVDLLTLAHDIEDLVDDVPVPAGFYEQLRVVVTQACIAVEGDDGGLDYYATSGFDAGLVTDWDDVDPTFCADGGRLQTPSFAQSGIKVKFPDGGFDVTSGSHYLLLDFDVSQSFGHQAGNSGKWVMHPVIRATEVGLSATLTVHLSQADTVALPVVEVAEGDTLGLEDFAASLTGEEVDAAFTDPDGDGVYTATFPYLAPDDLLDYIVAIEAPESVTGYTFVFDPVTVAIDLLGGQDVVVDFTLVAVNEVEASGSD